MPLTSCSACQRLLDAGACRCPHCDAALQSCGLRRSSAAALLALSLAGCGMFTQEMYGIAITDGDGDGFLPGPDCDDTDPDVNPDAPEVPGNGVDDDCDGQVDEADA